MSTQIRPRKVASCAISQTGSFDTFNQSCPKGEVAAGLALIYETLMEPSLDEMNISAEYGLLATAIKYPEDYSSVSISYEPRRSMV